MNLQNFKTKFKQLSEKSLFKDTSWLLIARLINVAIQAAYFILLARSLGAENYGSFVGITALASLLSPFVALGSDDILVKHVAVDRSLFASYWGNCLLVLSVNSILLTICLLLVSGAIFPSNIPLAAIGSLLIADLLFLNLQDATNKTMRAVNLVDKAAQLIVLSTLGKLIAIVGIIALIHNFDFSANVGLKTWSFLYLFSSLSVALIGFLTLTLKMSRPQLQLARLKSDLRQGIYFSLGMSASNINNNIDKTMLVSMATLEATGVYGSAYRFINIGDVPMLAMFNATYPKFFQTGAKGWGSCVNFAKKLLPIVVIYGILSCIAFLVLAPLVPQILGAEYQNVVTTLRWLAPLPFISGLHLLIANTLTGLGHQKTRSIFQVVAAGINIALNIWLIPLYGLYGAIWATLASDSTRVICLSIAAVYLYRKSRK